MQAISLLDWPAYDASGAHDNSPIVAQAIAQASVGAGADVVFPGGSCAVSTPIRLPRRRSTSYGFPQGGVVTLRGAGRERTLIQAVGAGWKAGMAVIDWDNAAPCYRTYGAAIRSLAVQAPNVAGTRAVQYLQAAATPDAASLQNERLEIELCDVALLGDNAYHAELCYLSGSVWNSRIDGLFGAVKCHAPAYMTTLLATDYLLSGKRPGNTTDFPGMAYSRLSNVQMSLKYGGYGQLLRGRFVECSGDYAFCDGGLRGAISYHFINSASCHFRNFGCEGQGEDGQFVFDGCASMTLDCPTNGAPNPPAGGGIGDGFVFRNSENITIRQRDAFAGQQAFNERNPASRLVRIGPDCRDIRLEGFRLVAASAVAAYTTDPAKPAEILDCGVDTVVSGREMRSGAALRSGPR